jgi:hypothetical protein
MSNIQATLRMALSGRVGPFSRVLRQISSWPVRQKLPIADALRTRMTIVNAQLFCTP